MARKLFCMVVLISLVILFQAAPGLANTYTLPGGDDLTEPNPWNETHGATLFDPDGNPYPVEPGYPGCAYGDFQGSYTDPDTGANWTIGKGVNSNLGTFGTLFSDEDGTWVTVTIVYNEGSHDFVAQNYPGPDISSTDTVITTVATYKADPASGLPLYNYGFTLIDNEKMAMKLEGAGTNDGTPFTFTADLIEIYGDHNHYGYVKNFELTYGAADPSAVPIPGAVWLLGSGLLGLACLRPRRKK